MFRTKVVAASLLALTATSIGIPAQAASDHAAQVFTFPLSELGQINLGGEAFEFVSGEIRVVTQAVNDPGAEAFRRHYSSTLVNVVLTNGVFTCRFTGTAQKEEPTGGGHITQLEYDDLIATSSCPYSGDVTGFFRVGGVGDGRATEIELVQFSVSSE